MSESNIEPTPEAPQDEAPKIDTRAQETPSAEAIAAIRAQIDSIDSSLLDLVSRRLALADGLAAPKAASGSALPIRPGREINLLRRLIAEAPAPLDADLIVDLWRTLISANVRRQAPIDVVLGGGQDSFRLFDIARRHFGARTRIHRLADPQAALIRALEQPNTVAVTPFPGAAGAGSWWPALSESRFHKLQLIAALPVRAGASEDPEACVFASGVPPEPAGGDVSLLMAFDPHHKAQRAMSDAGLKGREASRSEPRVLLRVEGFVAPDDQRLAVMARAGLDGVRVVGSYARV